MQNETEIQRDIPLLYARIQRCREAVLNYERAILDEERAAMSLKLLIMEDQERVKSNRRPRYEADAMQQNIARHTHNIETFRESIRTEEAMVTRTQDMISVLEADAIRPVEIVADLRQPVPSFRNQA